MTYLPSEYDMNDWSQPHLSWRLTFTNLPNTPMECPEDWFVQSISRWQNFSKQVIPLCKHEVSVRGSWTIYFESKDDVATIILMFAEYVKSAQSIEEFKSTGGRVLYAYK